VKITALLGVALTVVACGKATDESATNQLMPPLPDAATAPSPSPTPSSTIADENAKPGTRDWIITSPAMSGEIEGYADAISVASGADVHVAVSTTAGSFGWELFRAGWYGGLGARLVASGGPLAGQVQPAPSFDPVTGLIVAGWTPSFAISTAGLVTGVYLVRLNAASGPQSYAIFVVRDDTRAADVTVQLSTATWQAYNLWGGANLYQTTTRSLPDGRALRVSYDRPYGADEDFGAGLFVSKEMPLVGWLEARGYDVAYVTNSDTDRAAVPRSRAFITVGHDEYTTLDAMTHLTAARDAGTNLIFLSGDSMYWQVRFEQGGRVQTCYKEAYQRDPAYGVDDARVTTRFRDPPVNHPEDALLGIMSMGEANSADDWIVKDSSHWVYDGTGLHDGDAIPGLVGYEWDTFTDDGMAPAGLQILAASPVAGKFTIQNAAFYQSNGGWVFAAGTINFARHLDDARVAQMMTNLLAHAGARPAR
jgi:hypothetical protein